MVDASADCLNVQLEQVGMYQMDGNMRRELQDHKVLGTDVQTKSSNGPMTLSGNARQFLQALPIHEGIPLDKG